MLIGALAAKLPQETVLLNTKVTAINEMENSILMRIGGGILVIIDSLPQNPRPTLHSAPDTFQSAVCSGKDKKAVVADLKPIYQANSQDQGYERLLEFDEKWDKKYPLSVKGWLDNWVNLSTYFEYSPDIRRAIYTTNAIEATHRQIRKITKTKGAFTSDQALLKLVYLAIKDISKN